MSGPGDTLQRVIGAVTAPLARLTTELQSEEGARALLERLGWSELPAVPSELLAVGQALDGLASARADLTNALMDLEDGTDDSDNVVEKLAGVAGQLALVILHTSQLNESASNELPDLADTGIGQDLERRFFDSLVHDVISAEFPLAARVLTFLGILERTEIEADPDPAKHLPNFTLKQVNWSRLSTVLDGPAAIMGDVYGWGTPNIDADRLFDALLGLSVEFLAAGDVVAPSPAFLAAIAPGVTIPDDGPDPMLVLPIAARNGAVLAVGVVPIPKAQPDEIQGLGFRLIGEGDFDEELPLAPGVTLEIEARADLVVGVGAILRPGSFSLFGNPEGTPATFAGGSIVGTVARKLQDGEESVRLITFPGGPLVDAQKLFVSAGVEATGSSPDLFVRAGIGGGRFVVPKGDQDSFISSLMPADGVEAKFDFALGWSRLRGIFVDGSGKLEVSLPINQTIGPFEIQTVRAGISPSGGGVELTAGIVGSAKVGPVTASIDALSVSGNLRFQSGNLGVLDLGLGLKAPRGIGISVDGGAISGGGFLSFEPGRYSGAIELEAYSISIKAFGLIETGAAGGGFSFVIVISTEFATPIQLGLGFTLNGVGGLIGINRTVDSDALRALVVAGRTENLLFPKNVIANAPQIIRDLGTVFPAREGHYVFGPLAKLGWGTPTLITAELALILELPGPVLTLIGEVKCLLPKPATPLVKFNLSIAGQLDFPKKTFSLDAALHDSVINGYPVSGQMAMRLKWGEQPNFALSIGGFHPAYQPPSNFPKLQPMTVALAQQGSTSVTVSGFFALTSNTLQIGGEARLHAGGSGISLDASIAVKTIFIFSPFSFAANIDASVKISFRGYGPSVHLSGVLSGPSPWRAKGEVCVSILWWDACLRFDQTFGGSKTVPETVLDPWSGSPTIQGLQGALQDPKNWAALPPPGSFAVVSRAAGAADLVDPLGGFTVRQKAVPVETTLPIARFGPAKAAEPPTRRTGPIFFKINTAVIDRPVPQNDLVLTKLDTLKDFFAPAQFFDLNETKKLSSKSFEKHGAGYSFAINPRNIAVGASASREIKYTTVILGSGGTSTTSTTPDYDLPPAHLAAKSFTSAVGRGGFAQSGTRRYIDPTFTQPFAVNDTAFTLAHTDSLQALNPGDAPLPRADALVALDAYIAQHPDKRGQIQVVPLHELAAA